MPFDVLPDALNLESRLVDLDIPSLTVVNLGAGDGSGEDWSFSAQIRRLPFKKLINIELHAEAFASLYYQDFAAKEIDFYNVDMVEWAKFNQEQIDVCLLIDSLEHLSRPVAFELLDNLNRFVKKRTLIWLPLGKCEQHEYNGNPLQEHNSTWYPSDFESFAHVSVCWKHTHINPPCDAGWVTINQNDIFPRNSLRK